MTSKTATSRAHRASRKPATGKAAASKATTAKSKTGKLPEWNLADLYSGIDAAEIARDLQKMDADCTAFETDYKGKLAENVASDDGGSWLAEAVARYEAIDDLAGRLGSYASLVHAGDSVDPAISKFYGDVSERLTAASVRLLFFGLELPTPRRSRAAKRGPAAGDGRGSASRPPAWRPPAAGRRPAP
jgi:oligoendopeptidase F